MDRLDHKYINSKTININKLRWKLKKKKKTQPNMIHCFYHSVDLYHLNKESVDYVLYDRKYCMRLWL